MKTRRELKSLKRLLAKVKKSEEKIKNLSDNELKHLTVEFKDRYQSGESLDSLLPDACSYC